MVAAREWLDQLPEHYHDYAWLSQHANVLYTTLESALNDPPRVNDAIEGLITVCPYMFTRSDFKRWSSLLFDALVNAQLLQDDELQMRVWAQMGEGYYLAGQHDEARKSFETALERARQGRADEMKLAAYIGIFGLQSLRMDNNFNIDFVHEALTLAHQVDDLALKAKLHQALAVAYSHRGLTEAALGHGQIAYVGWYHLQNPLEMARVALTLAHTCRIAKCLAQAEHFLGLAASHFTKTDYAPSYCLIAYEQGIWYLEHQQYETARQWLVIGLAEATKLGHPYHMAMSHHSLAIVQIELQQYDDAEANLKMALSGWQKQTNWFHQANAHQALGYLEQQRGNITRARDWLRRGLKLCSEIPHSPHRRMIEQLITDTISELK